MTTNAHACAPAPTMPTNLTEAVSVSRTLRYATQNTLSKALADAVTTAITETERLDVVYLLDPPAAFVHTDGRLMAACEVHLTRYFAHAEPGAEDFRDADVSVSARAIAEDGTFLPGQSVRVEAPSELADLYDPGNASPTPAVADPSAEDVGGTEQAVNEERGLSDCHINHTTPIVFGPGAPSFLTLAFR